MSSVYNRYLDYLRSSADSHTLEIEAETSIYPLFSDLKELINHYEVTIGKFANVQSELVQHIERMEFNESDFDYYQRKFVALRKVDKYLEELKAKEVPPSIAYEMNEFISNAYLSISLYNLEREEERVLAAINRTYEAARENAASGCLSSFLVLIIPLTLICYTLNKYI